MCFGVSANADLNWRLHLEELNDDQVDYEKKQRMRTKSEGEQHHDHRQIKFFEKNETAQKVIDKKQVNPSLPRGQQHQQNRLGNSQNQNVPDQLSRNKNHPAGRITNNQPNQPREHRKMIRHSNAATVSGQVNTKITQIKQKIQVNDGQEETSEKAVVPHSEEKPSDISLSKTDKEVPSGIDTDKCSINVANNEQPSLIHQ